MIVCPNCQTENRLGSIFCRSCGTKLAIDDMNIQNFEEKTGVIPKDKLDKKKKKRKIVLNIVELILIFLIAYGIILVFQKPALPEINTSSGDLKKFERKRDRMLNIRKEGKDSTADFTEEEINSYAIDLVENKNQESKIKLKSLFVDIADNNRVKLYFVSDVLGQRVVFSIAGKVSANDDGLAFKPQGFLAGRMGKLPYPSVMIRYHTQRLLKKNEKLTDFLDSITSIEIDDNKATLIVGKK
jgi:hypothetical protein